MTILTEAITTETLNSALALVNDAYREINRNSYSSQEWEDAGDFLFDFLTKVAFVSNSEAPRIEKIIERCSQAYDAAFHITKHNVKKSDLNRSICNAYEKAAEYFALSSPATSQKYLERITVKLPHLRTYVAASRYQDVALVVNAYIKLERYSEITDSAAFYLMQQPLPENPADDKSQDQQLRQLQQLLVQNAENLSDAPRFKANLAAEQQQGKGTKRSPESTGTEEHPAKRARGPALFSESPEASSSSAAAAAAASATSTVATQTESVDDLQARIATMQRSEDYFRRQALEMRQEIEDLVREKRALQTELARAHEFGAAHADGFNHAHGVREDLEQRLQAMQDLAHQWKQHADGLSAELGRFQQPNLRYVNIDDPHAIERFQALLAELTERQRASAAREPLLPFQP